MSEKQITNDSFFKDQYEDPNCNEKEFPTWLQVLLAIGSLVYIIIRMPYVLLASVVFVVLIAIMEPIIPRYCRFRVIQWFLDVFHPDALDDYKRKG